MTYFDAFHNFKEKPDRQNSVFNPVLQILLHSSHGFVLLQTQKKSKEKHALRVEVICVTMIKNAFLAL